MHTLKIIDRELDEHVVQVPEGDSRTLLSIIQDEGLDISSSCGGGGWVYINRRVLTNLGFFKLKDLLNVEDITVLTEFGPVKAKDVACLGLSPLYRLTTRSGQRFISHPLHRYKRLRHDGTLEWANADRIKKGDFVLCRRGHAGLIPSDRGGDPDIWKAIGLLIGDGSQQSSGRLTWRMREDEGEIETFLRDFFESRAIPYISKETLSDKYQDQKRTKARRSISASVEDISSIIPDYPCCGCWRDGGLPEATWSLGLLQLKALLAGLYTSGGTAGIETKRKRARYSFYSTRRQLILDMKNLLMLLGIVTHYRYCAKRTSLGVIRERELRVIGQEGRRLFNELLLFLPGRKSGVSNRISTITRNDYVTGYRKCNELVRRIFPDSYFESTWHGQYKDHSLIRCIQAWKNNEQDLISDGMIGRFITVASLYGKDPRSLQILKNFRDQGGFFDEIMESKPLCWKAPGYDVRFSETNSYVCEGVVTHNCSTCCITVKEGLISDSSEGSLSAMDEEDLETMHDNGLDPSCQVLSCQTTVKGDCTIQLPYL